MIPILTKEQIYQLDKTTIKSGIFTEQELMDNAGFSIACDILENFQNPFKLKIGIVVGKGNNGIDGIISHYYLSQWNCNSQLILLNQDIRYAKVFRNYSIPDNDIFIYNDQFDFQKYDLVIDAILGVGNSRKLDDDLISIIKKVNSSKNIISVDIPSGLMTNSGKMADFSVFARQTSTLGYPKLAHFINDGLLTVGELQIHDIGYPEFKPAIYSLIEESDIHELLDLPHPSVHKYSKGKLLVIGGSEKYIGAIELTAKAGFRGGSGYIKAVVPEEIQNLINNNLPELIVEKYDNFNIQNLIYWADAIIIGPGLDIDLSDLKFILEKIEESKKPVVIDASVFSFFRDGLDIEICPKRTVFTPHKGELSMFYTNPENDFINKPNLFFNEFLDYLDGRYCLIKGQPNFLVNTDGSINLMNHGSPILATAGTGDILSGLIGSLLAQGYDESDSMKIGSWIHAESALIFSKKFGNHGLIASDLLKSIPIALKKYLNDK
ncbi:MAG: hypothetical protein CMF96_05290 [Candidatus Marinimicrobia bacterium]|mgnify:CR=1 FL=1|nr:hypothetical protein [Candidatus Neomarinimicrobiota bacterium]